MSHARSRAAADPARLAAFDVLRAVTDDDAYANLAMPLVLRERRLKGRDAALATELAYGALRSLGTYDAILAACADRPVAKLDPPLLDALRLGAHQLLQMRVPAHAAVSTSVDLVRSRVNDGAARLANAVLRKVAQHDLDAWTDRLAPAAADDPVARLAFRHAHPEWIVRAVRDAVGGDLAATEAFLEADNEPAEVSVVVRPGRAEVEELVAEGIRVKDACTRVIAAHPGAPSKRDLYEAVLRSRG